MRNLFLTTLLLLLSATLSAQNKYTIKGKVCEAETQEWLVGVSVGIKELPQQGSFSNESGNYTISLSPGEYTLIFKLLGFHTQEKRVKVEKNQTLDIDLLSEVVSLNEIEITAVKRDENVKSVQMGVDRLEIETINKIPVLLGERDILKTIQLLPGIQSAGEGNTGFYVRGGSGDQNLILLDNALVYNPSHLFGFFSTFNSDAVGDMTIYKGSMPVQYGGRLSSALDVSMRDGNMKDYTVSGGIGLISSKLTVEGPLQKDKSSFIVSGRRTYADALGKLMGVSAVNSSTLYFYDLNAKLSYILSDNDKLTISAYHGKDKLGLNDIAMVDWGNSLVSGKWNHRFSNKASSMTSLTLTNYGYNVTVDLTDKFKVASTITDYNINQEFNFYPNSKNTIKLGFNSIYRTIVPGNITAEDPEALEVTPFAHRYSWENSIFASNNTKINDNLEISYGIRVSTASTLGGGDFFTYDNYNNVVDTITSRRGEFVKTYFNFEPRFSIAYQLDKVSSIKAAFTRTAQNMHMLKVSNMEATPSDRWVTNTNHIKPELANQVSLGYFRNFANNTFEFSAEVYYKNLENQIDYKDGTADIMRKENVEPYLLFGKGRAYGLELFLKKKYGRFNGWVGYTLARSEKKIDGINDGDWYVANQDRTHDISVVGMFDLTKKWSLSGTFVYATGAPMTFPSGKYVVDGHVIPYYEGRNLYRAPAYHRMDLGATCILKNTKRRYSELVFSLYNAYGRKNAYAYGFRQSKEDSSKSETYMIYLFSVIPSVSWNFKF
ncbi:TonB-dependent receptor [Dysgonomonas sp. ZJ709]|uniref:TonB-dependent receptor n=1 Tax=Dysgonomonas sp. ZJ709 TaxID=2709797 RepID=UPI0013ED2AB5|nr:TonB-dependent receptor [Dysgonomonas sp. ZJ709]